MSGWDRIPRDGAANKPPLEMGDRVIWMPSAFIDAIRNGMAPRDIARELTGRVIYINAAHRYYTAEAECNGYTLRESFKY